ncbi:MAG: peptidylprolyl isomerase [Muribaculaceae bacterium]
MATLEKIRNKSVLLIVVIGVALIAFIIGDFFTSGRTFFGDGTTAAVVGKEKIGIQDFQRRYEEANQQMQQQNQSADPALVQNQVLNGMIQEILLNDEADKLGIFVTENELSEAMVGKNANPMMMQFAQQMGAESPAQLYEMIFSPTKFGIKEEQIAPARAEWLKKESEMEKNLRYMKVGGLIAGSIQANNLDKKAIYDENATTSYVNLIKKDYSSLKDSDFPVTDAELQAEYDKIKEQFKQESEVRRIHYIALDIKPSPVDEKSALKIVEGAVAQLKANPGVDAVRNNSDLVINESTVRIADITDPQVKEFVVASEIGAVSNYSHVDDTYTITKLTGKKIETDSVKINMVGVEGPKAIQDSVVNLLNAGTTLADIAKVKGVKGTQPDYWIPLYQLGKEDEATKAKILNAGATYFILNEAPQGATICQVVEKKAPKQMYEIATVSYKTFPSQTTIENLRDGLQKFITANNSSKAFADKAIAAGYQAVETIITPENPQIDRIENTRKAIQWVFGGEVGNVSSIFDKEANNKMVVVSIDEIIPAGYTPVTNKNVKTLLTNIVRRDKKATSLIQKFNGKAKDLAGFATIMESKVDTAVAVTFGQSFIPQIGANEPVLLGRVPVSKVNQLVGPVKGDLGVYVYQVAKIDNQGPAFNAEESAARFSSVRGGQAVMQRAIEILRKSTKIENKIIKFF